MADINDKTNIVKGEMADVEEEREEKKKGRDERYLMEGSEIEEKQKRDQLASSEAPLREMDIEKNTKKDKNKEKEDPAGSPQQPQPPPQQLVSFFSMYRYATAWERVLMIIGVLAAIANGGVMPVFSILLGQVNDIFSSNHFADPSYKLEDSITPIVLRFVYIGIATFVLTYMETGIWTWCGERQIRRVRENYLKAVLRQEIGWFDVSKPSEISTRIAGDSSVLQEAMGEKVGSLIHQVATFISGLIVGLVQGWQLTLVIISVTPILAGSAGFLTIRMGTMVKKSLDAYALAGGVAEECISNIRTVTTFNASRKESDRYTSKLKSARLIGIKKGLTLALGMGIIFFMLYCTYALAFWYGSKLISHGTINSTTHKPWTGGDVVSTFMAVITGAFAVGQVGPGLQALASGRAAAYRIFTVIDRESKIDPLDTSGEQLASVRGNLEFRNVHFAYPSRADVPVLRGLSLAIPHGKTVALVGESGCGKSTTIGLLEKFYLPEQGEVLVDGRDVRNLNTRWLRSQVGLVSQEPQLFNMTIAENIRFGKHDATMDEIMIAAQAANAHNFIMKLPKKYDTMVGEKGVQISGGQKQRIAIARAIVKNPSILLLDEATSALDTENERLVQEALDKMMIGRTTLVIAHRLATIKHADHIIVIKGGQVAEQGTHAELMERESLYFNLVQKQTMHQQQAEAAGASSNEEEGSTKDADEVIVEVEEKIPEPEEPPFFDLTFTKTPDIEQGDTVDPKKPYPFSYRRLIKDSRKDFVVIFIGLLGCCATGATQPIFSILYAQAMAAFQNPDPHEVHKKSVFLAAMFVCLAVGAGLGNFSQTFCFSVVGEKLTFSLRDRTFRSIMRQNIGWFDEDKNATGSLTTKLATDATMVQNLTTQRLSILLQSLATLIAGFIIAFIAGWKLTLAILACMPLALIGNSIQVRIMKRLSAKAKDAYEKAGRLSTEAVGSIRTVASFTNEQQIFNLYSERLELPMRIGMKKAYINGIGSGFTSFILLTTNSLAFWYGARLVDENEWPASASSIASQCSSAAITITLSYDNCVHLINALHGFSQMMQVFLAIIMMGMALQGSTSWAADSAKASAAASSIYEIIDRKSSIDPEAEGMKLSKVEGHIQLRNVHFTYPSRKNAPIFQGLDLDVPAGKKVALVGDSGGGKSTVIGLLERFYDPLQGEIFLDGIEIKSMEPKFLRTQISLVSQEPTLFSTTIRENIAYGKEDATLDEIIEAAKMANCHNFITSLPNGYNTLLGDKYTQLSGGQKQRVAIARALLCNPKVMLLDEATSALDSESETLVQEALERVMQGRTTIVIAHRLSTIMDADIIVVIKGGAIVAQGTHSELLARGGAYANLVKRQL